MKRLSFAICSLAVGSLVLSPFAYSSNPNQPAGKYERQYWDPSAEGQNTQEKSFQHLSPTQRDQKESATTPQKQYKSNMPAGKYERRFWDPTVE